MRVWEVLGGKAQRVEVDVPSSCESLGDFFGDRSLGKRASNFEFGARKDPTSALRRLPPSLSYSSDILLFQWRNVASASYTLPYMRGASMAHGPLYR